MKTRISYSSAANTLALALVLSLAHAQSGFCAQTFTTPASAVNALAKAVSTTNRAAFQSLFGADADWLANPDTVQAERELADFAAAFAATNHLVADSNTRMTLEVGTNDWPFPIPLVKTNNGWFFDTAAGREEILNRRIGRDELEVLDVMRAYVDAQRQYASRDRDGDQVLEYAQKLASSPGQMDGLYWPIELNGELSPLGPLVAEAQTGGYFRQLPSESDEPRSFHGYFFKILKRQGKHAPGGKYDYVINGNMIAGFALVAWPAEYGESGVMTFIVNQQGRVYQKDQGPKTSKIAAKMTEYDPDPSWTVSPD